MKVVFKRLYFWIPNIYLYIKLKIRNLTNLKTQKCAYLLIKKLLANTYSNKNLSLKENFLNQREIFMKFLWCESNRTYPVLLHHKLFRACEIQNRKLGGLGPKKFYLI